MALVSKTVMGLLAIIAIAPEMYERPLSSPTDRDMRKIGPLTALET